MRFWFLIICLLNITSQVQGAGLCIDFLSRATDSSNSRLQFIKDYDSLTFRTKEQNLEWITASESTHSPSGLFIEFTVSELKNLNDKIINNKDLVTALVNYNKKFIFKILQDQFNLSDIAIYSDYKTVRAFIPAGLYSDIQNITLRLQNAFDISMTLFEDEIKRQGFIRRSDQPSKWFQMGLAQTSDLAAIAARKAKDLKQSSLNYFDPDVLGLIEQEHTNVIFLYREIQRNSFLDYLFDENKNLSLRTVEIYRKNRDALSFSKAVKDNFGYEMSLFTASKLIVFFESIDLFSPSLIINERTSVAIDYSEHGAFSLDFIGLGAKNLLATIKGVISSHTLDELIFRVRENEKRVTEVFNKQKKDVEKIVMNYFSKTNGSGSVSSLVQVRFSGDEGIIIPNRTIELEDLVELQKALLRHFSLSELRLTYMRSDQDGTIDTQLVSLAEGLEKNLKKKLTPIIDPHLVGQTQFTIWVAPAMSNKNRAVTLVLFSLTPHSVNQRKVIRDNFNKVVIEANQGPNRPNGFILIPNNHVYGELPK